MKTTPNRLQTHWELVKEFLQKEWPRITDFDLQEIDGEYDRIVLKIKELYDGPIWITQEAGIKDRLQKFLNGLDGIL
ncbi:MAG: hypothetical protein Q7S98_04785 [Deltaproteobacteria bacterium]|nr:hypothetical protein [Deltaproteobacteria bacterium]